MKKNLKELAINSYRHATWPYRFATRWASKKNNSFPIYSLFYHRVADHTPNDWTITEDLFEQQIGWMRKNFDMISMFEAQQRIASGKNPKPAVVVTFDDGYADNCLRAIPFLIKERVPFTYFVSTSFVMKGKAFPHDVARELPLAPNDISSLKAMAKCPHIEIGAHTRTHLDLGKVHDDSVLFDEVIQSAQDLEVTLDTEIRYFAFPFGQKVNLTNKVFKLLKENGFLGVCSAYGGANEVGGDPFHIQRLHGDPLTARLKNWMTFDPRVARVRPFEYALENKTDQVESVCESDTMKTTDQSPIQIQKKSALPIFDSTPTYSQTQDI